MGDEQHRAGILLVGQAHQRGRALKKIGRPDIVMAGGVNPKKDYDYLYEAGVNGIFGLSTPVMLASEVILEKMMK